MARKINYGPNEITIEDDSDIPALLQSIEEAANSGEARWVEIRTEGDPHRILIDRGIPVFIHGTTPHGGRVIVM